MAKHMLTTLDNPYNPFDNFDEWLKYDESKGYYTNALLARVTLYADDLSEASKDLAIETAIDEIVKLDPTLLYKKLSRE